MKEETRTEEENVVVVRGFWGDFSQARARDYVPTRSPALNRLPTATPIHVRAPFWAPELPGIALRRRGMLSRSVANACWCLLVLPFSLDQRGGWSNGSRQCSCQKRRKSPQAGGLQLP